MRLHPRARALETESAFRVLARARELEAGGRDIIHLEIGQPDFPTPDPVCQAAARALEAGHTGYGPTPGLPELRAAVAETAGRQRGVEVPAEDVIITPGAKPLIYYALSALAGSGDEVVLPDPAFPPYPSITRHLGATVVPLRLRESQDFRFDAGEFRGLLSPKTRVILLNSPQNPTGGILTPEDLEVVAREAVERDLVVVSDEIYSRLVYDGEFHSILGLPGMRERTIVIDGFSKTYAMTGWRLGYGILPPGLIETFELYSVNTVSCVTTFAQYGALEALSMDQGLVEERVREFRERRDLLVRLLNDLPGVSCRTPGGAFYVFPRITDTGRTSAELASELLEEAGVAVLDGGTFGAGGEGFLRLSYASSRENLERACQRIGDYLQNITG